MNITLNTNEAHGEKMNLFNFLSFLLLTEEKNSLFGAAVSLIVYIFFILKIF